MAKRRDGDTRMIVYLLIGIAVGAALTYFFTAPRQYWGYGMGPGMMWGGGYGMMGIAGYMQDYRDTVAADCESITTEELIAIGDDVMGQMIGDEQVHERIDETHPNIDAVHLMMGRMATGCY